MKHPQSVCICCTAAAEVIFSLRIWVLYDLHIWPQETCMCMSCTQNYKYMHCSYLATYWVKKHIWKRLQDEAELGCWIGKSLVGNLSNAGSVILTWSKNASLKSLAFLTVTKLTHISRLIRSELTGLPGKESQTKAAEMAHIQGLCL